MKLNTQHRLLLLNMLPTANKQGTYIETLSLKHIIDKITFSESEISNLGLKSTESGITWNKEKELELDLVITKEQLDLLNKTVEYYDSNGQIDLSMLDLILAIKNEKMDNLG